MHLQFDALTDPCGIAIVDRVERQRYQLRTPDRPSLTTVDTDAVRAPVDAAVRFETGAVEFPTVVPVHVRDESGSVVADVTHLDEASLPPGRYTLDLGTQVKSYLAVESGLEVTAGVDRTRIAVDGTTAMTLGARSSHERPAATVTTTSDPGDVLAAVETFGSALKSLGPERSYPTLRGHPPALELGTELSVPDGVEPPDSGITLRLPRSLAAAAVAAPLSYYLGASVEPGEHPALVTETGFEHRLDTHRGFEEEVARVLKQCFLLDCITRTEGDGPTVHERTAVEAAVDLEFAALSDATLPEQVARYLSVPFARVEDHVPDWRLVTHVDPTPGTLEVLPFVVDDLAIVRTQADAPSASAGVPAAVDREYTRDDVITRSAAAGTDVDPKEFVEPQAEDSLEQAWVGDRIPIGASKLSTAAFRNRLDRDPTDGDISITVVQNDARMSEERELVDGVYGDRETISFDVSVRRSLSTDELADVLASDHDFLHYIGHIDHEGFTCDDGKLDVTDLDVVGADTFLLNACNSYHQGLAMVERGAIGGIVTLNEVINSGAVDIGETVARLLNCGFPLRSALTIAREESFMGAQYIVVGDGGINVTQPASGTPNLLDITDGGNGAAVEIQTYTTDEAGLGSIYTPYIEGIEDFYLTSGSIGTFEFSEDELQRFLNLENVPVRVDGELRWSRSVSLESFE